MFRQSAVFPIEGRAARMIRSEGCRPDVIRSRSRKPDGDSGDHLALVVQLLQQLRRRKLEFTDGYEAALHSLFRKAEQRLLRAIENLFRRLCLVEAFGHDFIRASSPSAEAAIFRE